jgi:hypothetical protein
VRRAKSADPLYAKTSDLNIINLPLWLSMLEQVTGCTVGLRVGYRKVRVTGPPTGDSDIPTPTFSVNLVFV